MIYYVLHMRKRTFEVFHSADKVGTYLLGKSITDVLIFKADENGERMYTPTDGDVFKIQKELEDL